jgi:hypothetical protein
MKRLRFNECLHDHFIDAWAKSENMRTKEKYLYSLIASLAEG